MNAPIARKALDPKVIRMMALDRNERAKVEKWLVNIKAVRDELQAQVDDANEAVEILINALATGEVAA